MLCSNKKIVSSLQQPTHKWCNSLCACLTDGRTDGHHQPTDRLVSAVCAHPACGVAGVRGGVRPRPRLRAGAALSPTLHPGRHRASGGRLLTPPAASLVLLACSACSNAQPACQPPHLSTTYSLVLQSASHRPGFVVVVARVLLLTTTTKQAAWLGSLPVLGRKEGMGCGVKRDKERGQECCHQHRRSTRQTHSHHPKPYQSFLLYVRHAIEY